MEIRWMIRHDLDAICRMHSCDNDSTVCFEHIVEWLRKKTVFGVVAEVHESAKQRKVVGYAIYEANKKEIVILDLKVDASCEGMGYGGALIDFLADRLNRERPKLKAMVSDRNLAAHLFLRACGFKAVRVSRNWNSEEDGYEFELTRAFVATKRN